MPTPKKGPRLGGSPAHQRLILSNLATQLIYHRSLKTTEAKAKMLQPMFEKLVTKAKRGDIHSRRLVARKIRDKDAVYELFDVIVPEIDPERQGGYTRIIRLGNRKGDNAPMVMIEIVTEKLVKKAVVKRAEDTAKAAAEARESAKETAAEAEKATESAETETVVAEGDTEATAEIETAETEAAENEAADSTADEAADESAKSAEAKAE